MYSFEELQAVAEATIEIQGIKAQTSRIQTEIEVPGSGLLRLAFEGAEMNWKLVEAIRVN